ncbi:glycogen debranching protein GlgX [Limibacter armeniacum]|uniref:glycogen debranching protein GlgX n=1 Tax=Limibacter armeniacum TaxID=466084 RepID=UPI002FE5372D
MAEIIKPGNSFPLGASVSEKGTNFCVFTKNATKVELLLFDDKDAPLPSQVIALDPKVNKTFYYWHVFIEGIGHGQVYAYRVYGDYKPEEGMYFDGTKVLLDPYAKSVYMGSNYNRKAAMRPGDNCVHAPRGIVIEDHYDWEEDLPLCRPFSETVIYEMHVGGFTKHESSGVSKEKRGTYSGLVEKIPYLKELGVTAVELLPVHQFDIYDAPAGKINYWGYSTIGFFAPHCGYATNTDDPTAVVREFKDMVKALHRAGIEVILDVVYNHSAEGPAEGPTLSFRGFENEAYYMLDREDNYAYRNYTGCGNTVNANHSIVRRLIMDSLRYWVSEMHVDGFRFDLASVLSRAEDGTPLDNPPILWEIESDPVLAGTKMIAEAWDAGGLYQVGSFIGDKWSEWNGMFRDIMRKFIKSDGGMLGAFKDSVEGSRNVYYHKDGWDPNRSINFITCHDGFTMNDLVSYNSKHNLANGENNQDGSNDNQSWNCGVEGPSFNHDVELLRKKQIKNYFVMLLLAQGTPMLLMGDEVRRSQQGNNNAYCQDNHISWFNWKDVERNNDTFTFVKKLIKFNLSHKLFQKQEFWNSKLRAKKSIISWHGVTDVDEPDFLDESRAISFMLTDPEEKEQLYVMVNAFWEPLMFELPEPSIQTERIKYGKVIDTSASHPYDIVEEDQAKIIEEDRIILAPRSIIVLKSM